ncbi:MAG: hypothetical protein H5T69_16380 [Chloroflexi bacterium]|nr:hypothetical protein [Chloroflexota bacterium]
MSPGRLTRTPLQIGADPRDAPRSSLCRAVIEAIDEAAGTANVRLKAGPMALLEHVVVAEHIPMELVHVGDEAVVLLWGDAGAVLLGPYGSPCSWPVQGRAANEGYVDINSTDYTAWAGLSVTLTLRESCYLWMSATFTASNNTARNPTAYRVALHIDGVVETPELRFGQSVANVRQPGCIALRSAAGYAPGAHTVDLRALVETEGDTVRLRNAALSVMALPD